MTDSSFGTPGDGGRSDTGQVRTYRGRTIEELIPRIRDELGPDAIILREREGLTGGIGGFFAQRCVEIDAQAAPRLSVYDDDFDDEDDAYEDAVADEEEEPAAPQLGAPAPAAEAAPSPAPAADEPWLRVPQVTDDPSPAAPAEPAPAPSPAPAPATFLDEASFAARLEEATLAADQAPPAADEPPPPPEPRRAAPPAFIAFDELGDEDVEPVLEPEAAPEPEPAPERELEQPTLSHRVLDLAEINYHEPAPEEVLPAPPINHAPVAWAPAPAAWEPAPAAWEPEPVPEPDPVARQPEPEPEPVDLAPDPAAPWMAFAAEQVTPEPVPSSRPSATAPAESAAPPPLAPPPARQAAAPAAPPAQTPAPPAPAPPSAEPPDAPAGDQLPAAGYQAWPPSAYGPRRRGGILPVAERMLRAALEATHAANERRNLELQARYMAPAQLPTTSYGPPPAAPPTPTPAPAATPASPATPVAPQPAPPVAEPPSPPPEAEADTQARRHEDEQRRGARLEERLVQSGVSPQRAATLVAAAVLRRGPFSADGELADEVRSAIASALPAPGPVPRRGAIAVVGAGGSGKTRSVAALATAYADAGIPVSVASFGGPAREDELGELLHGEGVNIIPAMRTRATSRAVASAREESLVIIDTASATSGAGSTIDVIAEALRSFELDAIYLAVPATLSLPAGQKLMAGFASFDLAGLIATHVDETDQLGMIAELAMRTAVPIAYTHTGLDLQNAIASADAGDIATSLV